jgi:hypothetical protein
MQKLQEIILKHGLYLFKCIIIYNLPIVFIIEHRMVSTLWAQKSNLVVACVFLVFIVCYKPCHISSKHEACESYVITLLYQTPMFEW